MPSHFLIPYTPIRGHKDPNLKELSYGDSGARGARLKATVTPGSYLFFHTTIGSARYLTGYIRVARVLAGSEARQDKAIVGDGRFDDWMFLGDKSTSRRLRKPLPFNRALAERLSLKISFPNDGRSETQVLASATRAHRLLSEADVELLLQECAAREENAKLENAESVQRHLLFYDESEEVFPFDEAHRFRELDLQKLFRKDPSILEKGARVLDYEKQLPDGDRLDLLLEAADGSLIVAELKAPNKLTDALPTQLASYCLDIAKQYPGRTIRKMVVCDGKVSPKLQKACKSLGIEIVVYGLKLAAFRLE